MSCLDLIINPQVISLCTCKYIQSMLDCQSSSHFYPKHFEWAFLSLWWVEPLPPTFPTFIPSLKSLEPGLGECSLSLTDPGTHPEPARPQLLSCVAVSIANYVIGVVSTPVHTMMHKENAGFYLLVFFLVSHGVAQTRLELTVPCLTFPDAGIVGTGYHA